ncbi:MAG: hypothetical protein KAY24_16865, partial [Candidatus Eisenbacteria sp.]|nr:hypothetical protein [Candidatus Eisenbacteria bacterium]
QMGHNCSACHGASDSEDVLACSSCHTTDEGEASSCEACHEADGYTADMLEHGDLVSIEGHTCTGCHAVSRGADAVHKRCNRCHADLEKGTFFTRSKDEPESVCKTCHMKR